ncbi:hypothetical protein [Myxococcus sp. Y35]|uniref:hypothetical protein n=1 Tax=Pseudomyxococcus flavus TaxID=3115648 RepID=UPI003CFA5959
MSNVLRGWFLVAGLGLAALVTGCGSECVDAFDCRSDNGQAPEGEQWSCRDEKCELVPTQGTGTDAGADAGTDAGADAGTDAGADAGTDPVEDAGTDPGEDAGTGLCPATVACVRFVNVLYEGNASEPHTAWDAGLVRMDVWQGDTRLFSAVEPGDTGTTDYAQVAPGTGLSFAIRTADSEGTSAALATVSDMSLAAGERVTLVGVGLMSRVGQATRFDRPQLLAVKEAFGAVGADEVRLRHITADRVAAANRARRLSVGSADPFSTVSPFSADATTSGIAGHVAPASTRQLVLSGSGTNDVILPSVSGTASFTLPAGALTPGTSYFAITYGDDRRGMDDAGATSLVLVPSGRNGALRIKRDPILFFLHGLVGGEPLRVFNADDPQNIPIAVDLAFKASPAIGDLPASATGHLLKFTLNTDPATTVLEGVQTGPLEAGRRYLVVVSGLAGQTGAQGPRAFTFPDTFAPTALDARILVVNASPNSPAEGISFGYFDVNADGSRGNTFTRVVSGLTYGAISSPAEGVPFTPATGTQGGISVSYLGVGSQVGSSPANRWARNINQIGRPYIFVVLGDWEQADGLTYRAPNVRNQRWTALSPAGDDFFAPATP